MTHSADRAIDVLALLPHPLEHEHPLTRGNPASTGSNRIRKVAEWP